MRHTRTLPILGIRIACLAALLLAPAVVSADPIRMPSLSRDGSTSPLLITSGRFSFLLDAGVDVFIDGPQLSVHTSNSNPEEFGMPGLEIEHADPAARTLPLGGHIRPNVSVGGPRLLIGGKQIPEAADIQFDLTFLAGAGVSDLEASGFCFEFGGPCSEAVVARGPFSMSGDMVLLSGSDDPLATFSIAGQGLATVGFALRQGEAPRPFARYQFLPTSVTPEPATTVLLVAPLAWLVTRRRVRNGTANH